jgi:polysaccharide export outer membrane protein
VTTENPVADGTDAADVEDARGGADALERQEPAIFGSVSRRRRFSFFGALLVAAVFAPSVARAQAQAAEAQSPAAQKVVASQAAALPAGYVIGPEDVLTVSVWREPDMSGEVTVRPDGMITLPLVGTVRAEGLAPEALKNELQKLAAKFVTEPNVTVSVKQVNSRKVFITGQVAHPGPYPLTGPRNVMQLISLAGGLLEYADKDNIVTLRTMNGKQTSFKFHYSDVSRGKALEQNIELQPGDTVVVP